MGLVIKNCRNITVRNCTFRNLGGWAVDVADSKNVRIENCTFTDIGDGGVRATGGNRLTLERADYTVIGCTFTRIDRWARTYKSPIHCTGCGMDVLDNVITDCPHSAIIFWGNYIRICGNEIYNVLRETGDAGAIYTGRNVTFCGNEICENFIHDCVTMKNTNQFADTQGIYNDDCVCNTTMRNNLIVNMHTAHLLGGGRDLTVDGDVIIGCKHLLRFDARGNSEEPVWRNMVKGIMRDRFYEIFNDPDAKALYLARFPQLAYFCAEYEKDESYIVPKLDARNCTFAEGTYRAVEVHGPGSFASEVSEANNHTFLSRADVLHAIPARWRERYRACYGQ
jgi:hypothetical protein